MAIVCGLPFVLLAGKMWDMAGGPGSYMGFEYAIGDFIYWFGVPLTGLRVIYTKCAGPLHRADHWWAIPVMSGLFLLQWVIWAQLIVTVMNVRRRKCATQP